MSNAERAEIEAEHYSGLGIPTFMKLHKATVLQSDSDAPSDSDASSAGSILTERVNAAQDADRTVEAVSGAHLVPSVGSAMHPTECRPCAWHWTASGCLRGSSCAYCHLCGEVEFRRRVAQRRVERTAAWLSRRGKGGRGPCEGVVGATGRRAHAAQVTNLLSPRRPCGQPSRQDAMTSTPPHNFQGPAGYLRGWTVDDNLPDRNGITITRMSL
eukprot:CAMPEP_0178421430 /NCGR_PEP_ID=MMETSP0689_2-20121128/26642_1 /TAXON_ID=160604 /ORGANISM="Amphidinium massartii, Strain CS-259" /LENGTH=213 /DNA_ID=CAMNT_0020042939 /DNA_START=174 /DNA_END=815 /DNA_ORIENTATION=+